MSKSLGNVVLPEDLVSRYGLDPVRYYLLREVPFGNDGYISHETMVSRINGDLANDIGNLAQRSLSMIAKNCDGKVPEPGAFTADDEKMLGDARNVLDTVRDEFGVQSFHRGLEAIWRVVSDANRYVDAQAPWELRKTDTARMQTVLYVLAETIRHLGILIQPVMPDAAANMLDQLTVDPAARSFAHLGPDHALTAGADLPKPSPVFPRFVEEEAAE